jgi:hypothetical protein
MNKAIAVKLTTPDGHEFIVYADGTYEGFPEGTWISNHIGHLQNQAIIDYKEVRTNAIAGDASVRGLH